MKKESSHLIFGKVQNDPLGGLLCIQDVASKTNNIRTQWAICQWNVWTVVYTLGHSKDPNDLNFAIYYHREPTVSTIRSSRQSRINEDIHSRCRFIQNIVEISMQIIALIRLQNQRDIIRSLLRAPIAMVIVMNFVRFIAPVITDRDLRVIGHWRFLRVTARDAATAKGPDQTGTASNGFINLSFLRHVPFHEEDGLNGNGLRHHIQRLVILSGNAGRITTAQSHAAASFHVLQSPRQSEDIPFDHQSIRSLFVVNWGRPSCRFHLGRHTASTQSFPQFGPTRLLHLHFRRSPFGIALELKLRTITPDLPRLHHLVIFCFIGTRIELILFVSRPRCHHLSQHQLCGGHPDRSYSLSEHGNTRRYVTKDY